MPDHPALEEEILGWWEAEGIFEKLRERNRGGPPFSFFDGPVTANRFSLGVHTAWGRTLKDVFQRYKALRGFDQRYQNGFDCQGLWIEVGVEHELGLNSKREIEEYGLEAFARKCRDVVVRSSEELTPGSIRLGQWMDWGNDYFTFSDTNIEYVWRMLKRRARARLALHGPPLDRVVPALRHVDLAARAASASYVDRADPSLYVRFPLVDRPGRVGRHLDDDAVDAAGERRRRREPRGAVRPPRERRVGRRRALSRRDVRGAASPAPSSSAGATAGRSTSSAGREVEHRVIPWDEVSLDDGTGIVHIAPGCGSEDFELGTRRTTCRC